MKRSVRRKLFGILSFAFWLSMFLIARSVRFQWKENPVLVSILLTGILIHIFWYQNRLSRLKKEKLKVKADNTKILKERIKLKLDPHSIPEKLSHLHLISEKWGIENDLLREDLYENSHNDELWELKEKIEINKKELEKYLQTNNNSPEFKALQLTLEAYNDLGLWTWKRDE